MESGSIAGFGWALRLGLVTFALSCTFGPAANAEIISLSAVDFVLRCSPLCQTSPEPDPSEVEKGVLKPFDIGTYFARVPFPANGLNVCSFALIHQDKSDENMTARLLRKVFKLGNPALNNPKVMAQVVSSGNSDNARRAKTTNINAAKISQGNSFYYVEVDVNFNLRFLGVQIDVRPTCP